MVALLGLFHQLHVALQVFFVEPGRPVDALQHRPRLVAAPVGGGRARQRESFDWDHPRVGHVRPLAQVFEAPLPIGADNQFLDGARFVFYVVAIFVEFTAQQAVDDLQFIGLILEQIVGFGGRHDLVAQREFAGDDLAHALLDVRQIGRVEGLPPALLVLAQIEVVVEAVIDGRADAQLGSRKQFQHGLGHDVGRRVPQLEQLRLFVWLPAIHRLHDRSSTQNTKPVLEKEGLTADYIDYADFKKEFFNLCHLCNLWISLLHPRSIPYNPIERTAIRPDRCCTNAASGCAPRSSLSRVRTATAPASSSLSPTTSM